MDSGKKEERTKNKDKKEKSKEKHADKRKEKASKGELLNLSKMMNYV
jgi:hypothetical protein